MEEYIRLSERELLSFMDNEKNYSSKELREVLKKHDYYTTQLFYNAKNRLIALNFIEEVGRGKYKKVLKVDLDENSINKIVCNLDKNAEILNDLIKEFPNKEIIFDIMDLRKTVLLIRDKYKKELEK